jgi:hypothetical protein
MVAHIPRYVVPQPRSRAAGSVCSLQKRQRACNVAATLQTIARLLEHRRGRGSSRLKVGALQAGQSTGPQASLCVPSTGIGRAESIPEEGL